jgi:energy-coupling factor transport system ATP-binding protein
MSIEVKNLTHTYNKGLSNEACALDGISFDVADGEFVGIIGPTGSGKSTLLQHLNGLLKPTEGSISIDGEEVINSKGKAGKKDPLKKKQVELRRKVGLVFQYPEYQLFEENVEKDVAFGPLNLGLDEDSAKERVVEALDRVGLDYEAVKDKSPFDFSGGQKRKIAIAGVIAMRPEILVLDEPSAGLDPRAHSEIMDMVSDLHGKVNGITILVSHNMNDIAKLCDRVIVLNSGRIVMDGTPEDVFAHAGELQDMGLDVPESEAFARKLRAEGFDIEDSIFTIDGLVDAIYAEIKGRTESGEN